MKTIKITADGKISIIDINFNDFRDIQKQIGGYFEIVKTRKLMNYFGDGTCFLVDEDGWSKLLPTNDFGTWFYNENFLNLWMIRGDIIMGKLIGEDIVGIDNPEEVMKQIMKDFTFIKEMK